MLHKTHWSKSLQYVSTSCHTWKCIVSDALWSGSWSIQLCDSRNQQGLAHCQGNSETHQTGALQYVLTICDTGKCIVSVTMGWDWFNWASTAEFLPPFPQTPYHHSWSIVHLDYSKTHLTHSAHPRGNACGIVGSSSALTGMNSSPKATMNRNGLHSIFVRNKTHLTHSAHRRDKASNGIEPNGNNGLSFVVVFFLPNMWPVLWQRFQSCDNDPVMCLHKNLSRPNKLVLSRNSPYKSFIVRSNYLQHKRVHCEWRQVATVILLCFDSYLSSTFWPLPITILSHHAWSICHHYQQKTHLTHSAHRQVKASNSTEPKRCLGRK